MDYSKSTNFTTKDTLPTGNSGKIVKGTELDVEFTAIVSAIASKANLSSPDLLGTPTAPTATTGTNTTQIASTAFVKTSIDSLGTMSTQNKTAVDITGGTIVGITDLAVADGGTGRSTLTDKAVLIGAGTAGITSISPGTSGNLLISDGTNWTSASTGILTSGTAQASTSGTSIDFTSIPSWVKRITVMFAGVSTNGTSEVIFRIGTSAGIQSTGYLTASTVLSTGTNTGNDTTGFRIWNNGGDAADIRNGAFTLSLLDSATGTWTGTGIFGQSDTARVNIIGGSKVLSAVLTQIRITTVNGTDTFDAGSINILYE